MSYFDYVLIGGGIASVAAAQSIRENDADGTIVILRDENHPPYDHPPLSKKYLIDPETPVDDAYSKFDDFYPKHRITLQTGTRVTRIDRESCAVEVASGEPIKYNKLLLATGASAKPLPVPGGDLPGVYTLRKIEDSLAIQNALVKAGSGAKAVIVGAGYIGMETAAAARKHGLDVTVIEPEGYPWKKFASEQFGRFLQAYYEKQGVHFVMGDQVASIEKDGDGLTVVTKVEQRFPAALVVAGVGAKLNTELAKDAGLEVDEKNGVKVSSALQTEDASIFVAGDIAYFPDVALGTEWHAEHHLNARWQGQQVGKNMATGNLEPYDKVAYFFSDEFDLHMVLRGNPQGGKALHVLGSMDDAHFVELYANEEGHLTMGIAVSRDEAALDPIADVLEHCVRAKTLVKGRGAELQSVEDLQKLMV